MGTAVGEVRGVAGEIRMGVRIVGEGKGVRRARGRRGYKVGDVVGV